MLQMDQPAFPESFMQQMEAQLGADFPAFVAALAMPPPVSIRYHKTKVGAPAVAQERVMWCDQSVYLPARPVFTLDPLFHGGGYYVQEASSMLIAEAIRQLIPADKKLRALDLCAAPGGKSTLLADFLPPESLLLSNEVIRQRYGVLQYNLIKWGLPQVHCSQHEVTDLGFLEGFFDVILVDAPCSGEGLFRKDARASAEWSPKQVLFCAGRQRDILHAAVPLLRPGGILLYSTCTYNDEENRANAAWLVEAHDLEYQPLQLPADWGIADKNPGYQCYPHKVRGEGLFLACFKARDGKESTLKSKGFRKLQALPKSKLGVVQSWLAHPDHFTFFTSPDGTIRALPNEQLHDLMTIDAGMRQWNAGFEVGTFKGNDFLPAPALALSTALSKNIPAVELDKLQALTYLRKEELHLSPTPPGWRLATYQGLGLGWFKGLPKRINNYYPREWRILMEIDNTE